MTAITFFLLSTCVYNCTPPGQGELTVQIQDRRVLVWLSVEACKEIYYIIVYEASWWFPPVVNTSARLCNT